MQASAVEREFQLRGSLAIAQADLLEAQTRALQLERRVVQLQREHATSLLVLKEENRELQASLTQENSRLHAALAAAVSSRWWRAGNKVRGILRRVKRVLHV